MSKFEYPWEAFPSHKDGTSAAFDLWLSWHDKDIKAEAFDEGALWSAVECGAISREQNKFLAPGDNPYREESK